MRQEPKAPPQSGGYWFALVGVVVSIILHLILDAEKPYLPFIVGCCLFWVSYIAINLVREPKIARVWGFRFDNLKEACRWPIWLLIGATLAMAILGMIRGTLQFPWHLPLLLLLYPLWGIIQQFLALAIVVGTLERINGLASRRWLIVLLTATLFSLVHLNDWRVMLATFALEMAFVPIYWSQRNLLPIAVVHGWLGAFYYLWVLNIDLLRETFG
jgi:hypothetical protein